MSEGRHELKLSQALQLGESITDACISFAQTMPVLDAVAQAVRHRRSQI